MKTINTLLPISEKTIQSLLEMLREGVWITDKDANTTYANPSMAGMLGYTVEEMIGKHLFEFMDEAGIARCKEKRLLRQQGIREQHEFDFVHKQGHKVCVLMGTVPMPDENGHYTGAMIAGVSDITEHQRAEADRQKAERRRQTIPENVTEQRQAEQGLETSRTQLCEALKLAKLGHWEYNVTENMFTFNDQFYHAYRTSVDQVGGYKMSPERYAQLFLYPEDVHLFYDVMQKVDQTKDVADDLQVEHRVKFGDGQSGYVSVRFFFVKDSQGNTVKTYGANQDITERKKAEMALRESETRYALAQRAAGVGTWEWNIDAHTIYWSEDVESLFGLQKGEFNGTFEIVESRIHPDDRAAWHESIRQCLEKGIEHDLEFRVVWPDNSIHWIHAVGNASAHAQEGPRKLMGIVADVTGRKKQEQKILDYQRQLRHLASELTLTEERLRRDVAMQLHDTITQSLAMIKVDIGVLRETTSDERLDETLLHINKALGQAIQESRMLTSQLSYPVLTVLGFEKAAEKWLKEEIEEKYDLHTIYDNDRQDKPLDDDTQAVLFRGFRELLVNVVKHARATQVKVSLLRRDKELEVIIRDNGIGCDVNMALSHSDGFGLLSIHEALSRLRGHLSLESIPGTGCTVTMTVPLATQDPSIMKPND